MRALHRTPTRIATGEVGVGWLGLATAWLGLGFGGAVTADAVATLLSPSLACGALSSSVCGVVGWGGLLLGLVALLVATLVGLLVARGFGPPPTWWVLPILLAALASGPFRTPAATELPWAVLLVAGVAVVAALLLAIAAVRAGRAALFGWVRLDGLDAREVPHRAVDLLVAPAALLAAALGAWAGGAVVAALARG